MRRFLTILVFIFLLVQCKNNNDSTLQITLEGENGKKEPLFTLLDASKTKLNFINLINDSPSMNGISYESLYNGGGVAIGDLNNDNLPDIYFISNIYSNKLFINNGDLTFKETTSISKVKGSGGFPTGVTMVDINSDGMLDIYICKSGDYPDLDYTRNELYINKGNNAEGIPTFIEDASSYGLDLPHQSTQAAFFDYDRDGDLDMFLINSGIEPTALPTDKLLSTKSEYTSDKLFRNDDGKYKDVSEASGIINNSLSFGLGVAIGDLNNDRWPDIVIGQDYSEKDHLYINQKDGTFKEVIKEATNHISNFSMGNDIGDINNDGWLDFITVDMVSNNNYDLKTSMSGMDPKRFQDQVDKGLHHQYMFNTLQLNNGDMLDGGVPAFSDIAQIAGVSNTNWSWAPLLFDMNNDGWQDLFVSNGVMRSFRNNDFIIYKRKRVMQLYEDLKKTQNRDSLIKKYYEDLLTLMPEKKEVNLLYLNNKNFTFSEMSGEWNLTKPTSTNGAAYADLDNDGDLDIIGNNINDAAFVYRNNTNELEQSNYLKVKLKGTLVNVDGIGARVTIETDGVKQTKELYLSRGFQSSVSRVLHFGVGASSSIQTLKVDWPDGQTQTIAEVVPNQQITLDYKNSVGMVVASIRENVTFQDATHKAGISYKHVENEFDDYKRESLLPHKMSQNGPGLSTGDINNDGLDDFYVGGAKNQSSALFVQQKDGSFNSVLESLWAKDKGHEDVASVFFDADKDGDLDLYVVSGGSEEKKGQYYQDRFYENLGDGEFLKAQAALPDFLNSGSCVKPGDFDNDGDLDLFVGGKLIPGNYPLPADSYLLKNESQGGNIKFVDVTKELAPFMTELGMVSDAEWVDVDNDNNLDLVIVGEWMPIKIIKNTGSEFVDISKESGLENQVGWWYSVACADFDKDGDKDFIVGNLGENYKYQASPTEPFEVYARDFDKSGSLDIVLGYHENGIAYPLRGRECSSNQMPFIKEKFPSYNDYGLADMSTVYGKESLEKSLHYAATTFATSYIENLGGMKFNIQQIDALAQFSSVNSILIDDFNKDGNLDVVLSGNLYQAEVETPRNDSGYGAFLEGNGKGGFKALFPNQSGLFVKGDVKNAAIINTPTNANKRIIFGKNDDEVQVVEY
jgi:hypothetical protein